jgi:DNA-directed RNA polymerase specialized sigma24 family protein
MWARRRRQAPDIPQEWDDVNPVSPEYEFMGHEFRDIMMDALDDLPDDQQVVVKLYYLDDWSYQEMSEILDLPRTTIKTRLHRARRHLKKDLLRRFAIEASLVGNTGFVTEALAGLSDEHRQVAHLHYVTGLSNREIAAWQNRSTMAVRTSLFKARRQLQDRLLGLLKGRIARRLPLEEDQVDLATVGVDRPFCKDTVTPKIKEVHSRIAV